MEYSHERLSEVRKLIIDRYRGYKCMYGFNFEKSGTVEGIQSPFGIQVFQHENVFVPYTAVDEKLIKLQLKRLSSITDENAREVAEIVSYKTVQRITRFDKYIELDLGTDWLNDLKICFDFDLRLVWRETTGSDSKEYKPEPECTVMAYQYLLLQGYALPQLVIVDGKPVILSVEQQTELGIIELVK